MWKRFKQYRIKRLAKKLGLTSAQEETLLQSFEDLFQSRKAIYQSKRSIMKEVRQQFKAETQDRQSFATSLKEAIKEKQKQLDSVLDQCAEKVADVYDVLTPEQRLAFAELGHHRCSHRCDRH